ncbi:hypothetical protein M5689_003708 [Euphorbia peplus]|nr:hypothetical protein M5689_003708 [Euphorbia peplus]
MEKKVAALFVMCMIVAATLQLCVAEPKPMREKYKACFDTCESECEKDGHGYSFCEQKCDSDCGAKEQADKLGINLKAP